ncbi:MAG: c-type cytochrome [Betaproteobacteria bacterium]|nr:c-type cytochrome [Betaproteobacteria bacterium]
MNSRLLTACAGIALAAAMLASPAAMADEALLKSKGCTACHANDKKLIGPAYKEVAKKYKSDAAAAAKLADKVIKGGQGVWGPVPMPPNKVTDDEAKKMVVYILAM